QELGLRLALLGAPRVRGALADVRPGLAGLGRVDRVRSLVTAGLGRRARLAAELGQGRLVEPPRDAESLLLLIGLQRRSRLRTHDPVDRAWIMTGVLERLLNALHLRPVAVARALGCHRGGAGLGERLR